MQKFSLIFFTFLFAGIALGIDIDLIINKISLSFWSGVAIMIFMILSFIDLIFTVI